MKRRARQLLTASIVATCLADVPAGADILIESHQDQRPSDTDVVLAPFRAELETGGVKVRAGDVVAAAGDQLPLPGSADPAPGRADTIELSEQVSLGTTQVLRGDYAAGLTTLEAVLTRARTNAEVVAADPASSVWLTKAYAAIAFAQIRTQQADAARATVAEQIRSFPEHPIGRIVGPEVAALADQVRKALDAAAHGALQIIVTPPDVQMYLNDRLRAIGGSSAMVVPGTYRLVLSRAGVSRRYLAQVLPNKATALSIDWGADTAFRATTDWVGFVWPHAQGDRHAAAVTRYARGSRQHDMLVVSILDRKAGRFLVGEIFEKRTGALLRSRAIELTGHDEVCERALARYLLTGNGTSCLREPPAEDGQRSDARVTRTSSDRATARSRAPVYVAMGVAAAAVFTGGYLLQLDGTGTCGLAGPADCPQRYATASQAWALFGVGAAAAGFGIYWYLRTPEDAHPTAITLAPTGTGAMAAVQGVF